MFSACPRVVVHRLKLYKRIYLKLCIQDSRMNISCLLTKRKKGEIFVQ